MATRSVLAATGALLWLAGCSAEPQPEASASPTTAPDAPTAVAPSPAASAEVDAPALSVEGEGLRWFLPSGAARPMPFGTPRAELMASLERVRGAAETGTQEECGAGPVAYANWPDGLTVLFQDDRFAGWSLSRMAAGKLSTANGVGPGTTREVLAGSFGTIEFMQSTLGTEFIAGDLSGVLDGDGPDAQITDMWAGVSCVAR